MADPDDRRPGAPEPRPDERRATTWYDATQVRARLNFTAAYSGTLHLYAVDWGTTTRREDVTVDDGSGHGRVNLSTDFDDGAWMHFPISVAAGGSVVIKVEPDGRHQQPSSSGLFLGGAGTPPPPPPPPPPPNSTAGRPGRLGRHLRRRRLRRRRLERADATWSSCRPASTVHHRAGHPLHLVVTDDRRPGAPEPGPDRAPGDRPGTTPPRSAPAQLHRGLQRHAPPSTPSTGSTTTRRENVTVDDGSDPRTISLATAFNAGAWMHFPITVAAGGSVVISRRPDGRHQRRPLRPVPGRAGHRRRHRHRHRRHGRPARRPGRLGRHLRRRRLRPGRLERTARATWPSCPPA